MKWEDTCVSAVPRRHLWGIELQLVRSFLVMKHDPCLPRYRLESAFCLT